MFITFNSSIQAILRENNEKVNYFHGMFEYYKDSASYNNYYNDIK